MNIHDRLHERLRQCRRDLDAANQRAADAAHHYIERRLAQLDGEFSRHGFGWHMPTGWRKGLVVVPAIRGWHDIDHALQPLRKRCRSDRLYKLTHVGEDLDRWAGFIKSEFGKPIGEALSPRLKAWGVILDLLPAQPKVPSSPTVPASLLYPSGFGPGRG